MTDEQQPVRVEMRICVPPNCVAEPWWVAEHVRSIVEALDCTVDILRIDPPQPTLGE